MSERLHKVLAHAGVASRRAAERMILAHRVRVNGALVRELGTQVDPDHDRIEVDGQPLARGQASPRLRRAVQAARRRQHRPRPRRPPDRRRAGPRARAACIRSAASISTPKAWCC